MAKPLVCHMKKLIAKSGREVEEKILLPPSTIALYKGVSEDLVEVEVDFEKIVSTSSKTTKYFDKEIEKCHPAAGGTHHY